MRNPDIGDNSHHGLCGITQIFDLIGGAHSHLHHRYLGFGGNGHQCFGRTDFVILVALGLDGPVGGSHHCRGHFFGGGLAHAAGNADYFSGHFTAVQGRDLQKRPQAAFDPQHPLRAGIVAVMLRHGCRSARRQRLIDVVMPIYPLARQCNEQCSLACLPTVGDDTGDLRLRRLWAAQYSGYFSQ